MSHIRFPSWSFDDLAQFELDTLEDIFKRSDWQDRALKPALSSILAPALCAVYGKQLVFTLAAFLGLQPRDKAATLEVKTMPIYPLIGHFRVASSLCFKARLSVKPVIWKWLFTSGPMQMKYIYIFTRKALHLAWFKSESFWNYEIAGLHVTTRRPCGRAKTKSISILWKLNFILM